MLYSLTSIKPNVDYPLSHQPSQIKCNDNVATVSYDPNTASAQVNIDGIVQTIKKDTQFKIGDARFTVKIDNEECVFYPQSEGMQAQGDFNNPLVYKSVQNNVREILPVISRVSELEQNEQRINASNISSYRAPEAAQGYALTCQLYLLAHAQGLIKREREELENAYKILVSLSELATSTDDIYLGYYDHLQVDPNWYDGAAHTPAAAQLAAQSKSLTDKLLKEKSILINWGLQGAVVDGKTRSGHYEVLKVTFSGNSESGVGIYHYTVYNAGYESKGIDNQRGIVAGVREYLLKCENRNDIERFIQLAHERMLRADVGATKDKFEKINKQMKSYSVREIRDKKTKEQVRGNCTTMSTRLALEDMLTPETFRKLHNFVSNTQQVLSTITAPRVKERPPSPDSQVKSAKVAPGIAKLADQLAAGSRLFQNGGVHVAIQEAINRGQSDNIVPLLTNEKNKSRSNYLAGSVADDSVKQTYTIDAGKKGTLLHYAIILGNKDLAEYCLQEGMSGFEKDGSGYPALHTAIILGQNAIAQMIIKAQKNPQLLATQANDGITAVKLALECDRMNILLPLVEAGVDLSPEKNNDFVIFNLLVEKALFGNTPNTYLSLANAISKNPAKNNVNLLTRDGSKENVLDIMQGLFSRPVSPENQIKITPELIQFANELMINDLDTNEGLSIIENSSLTNTFPYMEQSVFEKLVKLLKENHAGNPEQKYYYLNLMLSIIENNDVNKLKYVQSQQLNNHALSTLIILLDEVADGGKLPVSKKMLGLILNEATMMNADSKKQLQESLLKFFSAGEVDNMIKHIEIKQTQADIINPKEAHDALVQVQAKEQKINQAFKIRYEARQEAFYQFGDLTRSIIKFITGLDVVRENASLNPGNTTLLGVVTNYKLGDISRFLWASVAGTGASKPSSAPQSSEQNPSNKKSNTP